MYGKLILFVLLLSALMRGALFGAAGRWNLMDSSGSVVTH